MTGGYVQFSGDMHPRQFVSFNNRQRNRGIHMSILMLLWFYGKIFEKSQAKEAASDRMAARFMLDN
jgi:hypothetical protein